MQIFNTKVVPASVDAAWAPAAFPDMAKSRLLVISRPFYPGSAEEQTLVKMMGACKLTDADYVVVQVSDDLKYSWQSIGAIAPKLILLLGVMPADLSIHALFRLHMPNTFGNHVIIPALSLTEIEKNAAAKKELWASALKPAFGL